MPKNVGVAGYAEDFWHMLSGKSTSEDASYLLDDVLVKTKIVVNLRGI